ncbi:MAG: 16S rRNA (guanine(527)-N(7))-methyltransferase RsmG [Sphingomonas bacterium]|nr:16S rRNA (guanine(527)-N(7))-methyltransferase RsmG [Sphingomonas bacterium]
MIAVSRGTAAKLEQFEALVRAENIHQNLVSASTLTEFATRHVADGAQLIGLAPPQSSWCDIGSGAGLPGIVVAIITGDPVALVEPRRLRADFLRRACQALALDAIVIESKADRMTGSYDVITARAVADLATLFAMTEHLAHSNTRWIFPKGRNAQKELDAALQSWQGEFAVVPSETSDEALIVVAERVRRRGKR